MARRESQWFSNRLIGRRSEWQILLNLSQRRWYAARRRQHSSIHVEVQGLWQCLKYCSSVNATVNFFHLDSNQCVNLQFNLQRHDTLVFIRVIKWPVIAPQTHYLLSIIIAGFIFWSSADAAWVKWPWSTFYQLLSRKVCLVHAIRFDVVACHVWSPQICFGRMFTIPTTQCLRKCIFTSLDSKGTDSSK